MSRLAKKPITIPPGLTVRKEDGTINIKGTKGELRIPILSSLNIKEGNGVLEIVLLESDKKGKMNSGTMWSLIKNAIDGVTNGFSKILEIEGIGYRANMDDQTLVLSLGYTNPIRFQPPEGISISVEKNVIKVSGIDKALVGQAAAMIRNFKKPEPYKGKGIHYQGEVIRRKAGKKTASTS